MPEPVQSPPLDGLKAAIEAKQRQYGQRPASPYPATDRAIEALRREYPNDLADVDVKQMDFTNPLAFSTVVGTTDPANFNQRQQNIELNPALEMLYPENMIQSTLAHELRHAKDLRNPYKLPKPPSRATMEFGAEMFEDKYSKAHGLPDSWRAFPDGDGGMPKMLPWDVYSKDR